MNPRGCIEKREREGEGPGFGSDALPAHAGKPILKALLLSAASRSSQKPLSGVRNLKRCIESIIEKLNVLKLIYGYKSTKNIESDINDINDIDIKNIIPYNIKNFSLPIIITDNIIKEFIKLETDTIPFGLYM